MVHYFNTMITFPFQITRNRSTSLTESIFSGQPTFYINYSVTYTLQKIFDRICTYWNRVSKKAYVSKESQRNIARLQHDS